MENTPFRGIGGKGSLFFVICSHKSHYVGVANEILMHFRAGKKTAQDISFSEPIETDKDGNELTLIDVVSQDDTIIDDLDQKINAEKLYRYINEVLNDREREVVVLRYGLVGDGMTQREVAKKLYISRSYVSRIEKKALEKLKIRFENGDKRIKN